jgi:hypothetical protein
MRSITARLRAKPLIEWCLLLLWCGAWSGIVEAKLLPISLEQLVREADVIFVGRVQGAGGPVDPESDFRVPFVVEAVLKGAASQDGRAYLCEYRPDSEWPILASLKTSHLIFAKRVGGCLILSSGSRSTIPIIEGVARTSAIAGQPLEQKSPAFEMKIHKLVTQRPPGSR